MKVKFLYMLPVILAAGCTVIQDDGYPEDRQVARVYGSHHHRSYQRPDTPSEIRPSTRTERYRPRAHVSEPEQEVHTGGYQQQPPMPEPVPNR